MSVRPNLWQHDKPIEEMAYHERKRFGIQAHQLMTPLLVSGAIMATRSVLDH